MLETTTTIPAAAVRTAEGFLRVSCYVGFAAGGVALVLASGLGASSYDVLVSGVSTAAGTSFGLAAWCVSATLFAVAALLGQRPRVYNLYYALAMGPAVEFFIGHIPTPSYLPHQVFMAAAGALTLAFGLCGIIAFGVNPGPLELLMAAGEERGVSRTTTRTGLEVGSLLIGALLGGAFGGFSVVLSVCFGPLMAVTMRVFTPARTYPSVARS